MVPSHVSMMSAVDLLVLSQKQSCRTLLGHLSPHPKYQALKYCRVSPVDGVMLCSCLLLFFVWIIEACTLAITAAPRNRPAVKASTLTIAVASCSIEARMSSDELNDVTDCMWSMVSSNASIVRRTGSRRGEFKEMLGLRMGSRRIIMIDVKTA